MVGAGRHKGIGIDIKLSMGNVVNINQFKLNPANFEIAVRYLSAATCVRTELAGSLY